MFSVPQSSTRREIRVYLKSSTNCNNVTVIKFHKFVPFILRILFLITCAQASQCICTLSTTASTMGFSTKQNINISVPDHRNNCSTQCTLMWQKIEVKMAMPVCSRIIQVRIKHLIFLLLWLWLLRFFLFLLFLLLFPWGHWWEKLYLASRLLLYALHHLHWVSSCLLPLNYHLVCLRICTNIFNTCTS